MKCKTGLKWGLHVKKKPKRIPVQILLSTSPSFVMQPRYEAPGDMQVKLTKEAVINIE